MNMLAVVGNVMSPCSHRNKEQWRPKAEEMVLWLGVLE